MLNPCPVLHRYFCAWVGAIRFDSGKDHGGHSWSVDCTVSWPFLSSCHSTSAYFALNVLEADGTVAQPVYSFLKIITCYMRSDVSREPAASVSRVQNVIWTCMFVRAHFAPLDSIVRFTWASYWPAVPDVSHLEEYCLQGCDAG
jgi:hypothetical protein